MNHYIIELLKSNGNVGMDKAIKSKEILKLLGRSTSADSQRSLKKDIQDARREWRIEDGIESFILSDTGRGYYLPSNDEEVQHFFYAQNSRAVEAFRTIKELRCFLMQSGSLKKKKGENDRQKTKI